MAWVYALTSAVVLLLIASCESSIQPAAIPVPVAADELREPAVVASSNGVLDLLIVAKAAVIPQFAPYVATGWVYEVCARPASGAENCPATDANSAYGGTRLQIDPGDTLKIHLVNKLPTISDAALARDPAHAYLRLNPTNLHLHGMLVSPRYASIDDATWGDNVFIYNFNSANGMPPVGTHLHGTAAYDAVDYKIPVPRSHPAGLYWFHPHVHGISANQISSGLSGIVTVGRVADFVCSGTSCAGVRAVETPVRHVILKDTQVLSDGTVQSQLRSEFCDGPQSTASLGGCEGVDLKAGGGPNFVGGRWFFTINGQQFPTITVGAPFGQLWRITNASANATYELNLWNPDTRKEMPLRVVSIDGVSIDVGSTTNPAELVSQAGNKFTPVPCPGAGSDGFDGVCTTRLHMMPSSRAEVWVTYRDANGEIKSPAPGARAVFRTNGYSAGPGGDRWPAIDLAKVSFAQGTVPVTGISIAGQAATEARPIAMSANLQTANAEVPADPACMPLAPGHRRRIFFNASGLGYEEVDGNGVTVPGTFIDVHAFDPMTPTICLPLGAGNAPVTEQWELVNLANQDHNFHLHQVHFSVLSAVEVGGTSLPSQLMDRSVVMDSVPLPYADGRCLTVQDWRNGACTAHIVTVEIPFAVAGDFVYHCHIVAHEDGGMMAVIRVRSDASASTATLVRRLPDP